MVGIPILVHNMYCRVYTAYIQNVILIHYVYLKKIDDIPGYIYTYIYDYIKY